ncbi:thiamine phosphate synthase [Alteromonas lipotrueiana]|uniref:thiamine phosphate synthase n=1 Tax=Alteromonas lipotrueiana TaxID=2803815 RepID=UPI001C45F75E|nr:thiamine phosphate synthase [Alteromonas lipotrueiana]
MSQVPENIWAIGGWDTSGGAGLTRDAIVASQLSAHCTPLPTLISLQTHDQSYGFESIDTDLFKQQLLCAIKQPPAAIKVGAVADDAHIQTLIELKQRHFPEVPLVWDPVMQTSCGGSFGRLTDTTIAALLQHCTLVTPNLDELYRLADTRCYSTAVKYWQTMGARALLVKSDSACEQSITDTLYTCDITWRYTGERFDVPNVRGTGCTLATSLAVALARNYAIEDAMCLARAWIHNVIANAHTLTSHQALAGPAVCHPAPEYFAQVQRNNPLTVPACRFAALHKPKIGLYPVIDDVGWLPLLIEAGITTVQLRIKHDCDIALRRQIHQAVKLCYASNIQLFINDHWQLAIEAGAFGVHLGQDDLNQANLEAIATAGLRLGVSTHGYAELCRVLPLRPSYIALGHVFATKTKAMPSSPQGTQRLSEYRALCQNIPTVAIGGINLTRLPSVQAAGITNVAVVSAITQAENPAQVISGFQKALYND